MFRAQVDGILAQHASDADVVQAGCSALAMMCRDNEAAAEAGRLGLLKRMQVGCMTNLDSLKCHYGIRGALELISRMMMLRREI